MNTKGSCTCGKIVFYIDFVPNEIAICHCSICRKIHKQTFTKFAKCHISKLKIKIDNAIEESVYRILFIGSKYFAKIISSNRAMRLSCGKCGDILFMYYHQSENIWIVVDKLDIDINNIVHYDIYKN
jgi:hypothetical protein